MKYFDAVKIENIEIKVIEGAKPFLVSAAINADGENYYDFQKNIATKYTCVINTENSVVRYITGDASTISPGGGESVFGIDNNTDNDGQDVGFDGTWKFNKETLTFYRDSALVAEIALRNNKDKFERLLRTCTDAAFPLQSAVSMGIATDEQKTALEELKNYSVNLMDAKEANAGSATPAWPPLPEYLQVWDK